MNSQAELKIILQYLREELQASKSQFAALPDDKRIKNYYLACVCQVWDMLIQVRLKIQEDTE